MTRQEKKKSSGISRREFLKNAGLLVGGVAIASPPLLASCSGGEEITESGLITVLNPEGQPPPIILSPMAPRLDTMDGKTIYLVDINFTGTQSFLEELEKVFAQKYPKTKIVRKVKAGAYAENDPVLWDEIKKYGHAVVMGIGH
jgi:hypothetical protein